MSVTKLEQGSVILPEEVREALGLEEGETLYVEIVAGGVLVRRAPLSREERDRAWDEVLAVVRTPKGEDPDNPEALESQLTNEVKELRRTRTTRT